MMYKCLVKFLQESCKNPGGISKDLLWCLYNYQKILQVMVRSYKILLINVNKNTLLKKINVTLHLHNSLVPQKYFINGIKTFIKPSSGTTKNKNIFFFVSRIQLFRIEYTYRTSKKYLHKNTNIISFQKSI